jgi:hypothetical protein
MPAGHRLPPGPARARSYEGPTSCGGCSQSAIPSRENHFRAFRWNIREHICQCSRIASLAYSSSVRCSQCSRKWYQQGNLTPQITHGIHADAMEWAARQMRLACLLVLVIRLSLYHPPFADALLRSIRPLRDVTRVDSAGIPGHTSELDFRLIIDRGASSLIRLIVLELTCTSVQVGELGYALCSALISGDCDMAARRRSQRRSLRYTMRRADSPSLTISRFISTAPCWSHRTVARQRAPMRSRLASREKCAARRTHSAVNCVVDGKLALAIFPRIALAVPGSVAPPRRFVVILCNTGEFVGETGVPIENLRGPICGHLQRRWDCTRDSRDDKDGAVEQTVETETRAISRCPVSAGNTWNVPEGIASGNE